MEPEQLVRPDLRAFLDLEPFLGVTSTSVEPCYGG